MFRQMDQLKKKKITTILAYFGFWCIGLTIAAGLFVFIIMAFTFFELFTNISAQLIFERSIIALSITGVSLFAYTIFLITKFFKKIHQLRSAM